MWTFACPRAVIYGDDALESLSSETADRVLIVTDSSIAMLNYVEMVKSRLRASKIAIFNEVEPEPSLDTAFKCAKIAKELDPQLIIAIGGGSVLDVAKMARILMEIDIDPVGITPFIDLFELGYKKKAKLIAIPTTSGT
ncbi:MAG: iron-containing alcohol dehydrogenase, partial [Archaeoglobaceae archaeon]